MNAGCSRCLDRMLHTLAPDHTGGRKENDRLFPPHCSSLKIEIKIYIHDLRFGFICALLFSRATLVGVQMEADLW